MTTPKAINRPTVPPVQSTLRKFFELNDDVMHTRDRVFVSMFNSGYSCEISDMDKDESAHLFKDEHLELHLFSYNAGIPSIHMKIDMDVACEYSTILGGIQKVLVKPEGCVDEAMVLFVIPETDFTVLTELQFASNMTDDMILTGRKDMPIGLIDGRLYYNPESQNPTVWPTSLMVSTGEVGEYSRLSLETTVECHGYKLQICKPVDIKPKDH